MAEGGEDDAEKTEEPSQRKLQKAHEKGDVAKSQEVSMWFSLIGITIAALMFGKDVAVDLSGMLTGFLSRPHDIPLDGRAIIVLTQDLAIHVLLALMVTFLIMMIMAVAGNLVQHKPVFTAENMKPKLEKISLLKGFKRLFSAQSLVNFLKGILKITIVSAVIFLLVYPEKDKLDILVSMDILGLLLMFHEYAIKILIAVVAIMSIVAAMDFLYQKQTWMKKQRMSMKELKEEYKQTEGDPHIKAKIRQLRMERSRQRMMAAVPSATVVVTNPTHFAVALKYEEGMEAPLCVAKGTDAVALKIREVAGKHDVPIVENKPLARALHASVDVDQEIPVEHYQAVAELIGYVMRLKRETSWKAG